MATFLRAVYAANILVAGTVGVSSLFFPRSAASSGIFRLIPTQTFSPSLYPVQTTGALWLSITALSALGLYSPYTFSPILLIQLIYKSLFLAFGALPGWRAGRPIPLEMSEFFAVWVAILPFAIPWSYLFQAGKDKVE